ncbi:MAG: TonB-dependent siderophore receptor [Porticoccaceae bacterium]
MSHKPCRMRHLSRPLVRGTLACAIAHALFGAAATLPLLAAPNAQAQTAQEQQARHYDIPAGPLEDALNRFGKEAGIMLSFATEATQGLQSGSLKGSYTVQAGLDTLLAGSGLRAESQANGGYTLVKIPEGTSVLPTVRVRDLMLDTTTEGTGSYAARGASIMKGAELLKEIPQSVSVITRQRIEDQNLTSVRSAMEQAPGIYVSKYYSTYGAGNNSARFYSRGFELNNYMVDGVTSNSSDPNYLNSGLAGSSAIYDRVEILRGAAGLLVGNGNPGGTVNLVRKRPTKDFQQIYTLSAGSWNNHTGQADISGSLINSGELRGRMVVAYNRSDRFWDHTESESPLLYGIIEADLSSATRISLGIRHEKYNENAPKQGSFFDIPSYTPGKKDNYSPTWGYADSENKEVFLNLNHEFNERWSLALASSYIKEEFEAAMPITFGVRSNLLARKYDNKTYSIDTNLLGALDIFGREHKVTLGLNASNQYRDFWTLFSSSLTNISQLNNWDWPYDQFARDHINSAFSDTPSQYDLKSHGAFAKLDFKLTENLTVIIGGRTSWYDYEYTHQDGSYRPTGSGHVSNEFTPYAAFIYSLTPEWSAYISYADIFNPQWGMYTRSGSLIDHEKGRNYEAGIKGELFDGRLNTSFAIYQADRENTARMEAPPYNSACPGNPTGGACYVATGQTRTQGFDVEINGEVLPGWQIGAGYTYTDSEIRKADYNQGFSPTHTPEHMLKVFSSYALNEKLTLGGGVQIQSEEKELQANWALSPQSGYALYSAFGRYKINKNIDASLNINNIFDKKYWSSGSAIYRNQYGEPRSYMLTLRARF